MKRRDEVLVGLFTTIAVAVLIIGSLWLVRGGLQSGYPLHSRFTWGAGLKVGQPVWLSGVTIGFVDRVDLEPQGSLVVTYRVNKEYKIPTNSTASVVPNGFFGDMAIGITPLGPSDSAFVSGDTIPAGPPSASLGVIIARIDTLAMSVGAVTHELRAQMVDSGGISQIRRLTTQLNQLGTQFGQIANEQSRQLSMTMASIRSAVNAVDSARVDSTVRALQSTAARFDSTAGEFRNATGRVNSLLARVENGDGTASKLLNDPGLYNDLRLLTQRMDSLMAEFKKNPRRFIDLRIF